MLACNKEVKSVAGNKGKTIRTANSVIKSFGCARWYWNYANACIQHYEETGKSLKFSIYKGILPQLSRTSLAKQDCYSSVLQCSNQFRQSLQNFFEGRTKFLVQIKVG